MIYLSDSIRQILNRIDECYAERIFLSIGNQATVQVDEKVYSILEYYKMCREDFGVFKTSLENGTSEFLECDPGEEYIAKVELTEAIEEWCELFTQSEINYVFGETVIQPKLKNTLKRKSLFGKLAKDAKLIISFIEDDKCLGWGANDLGYRSRRFNLIESEKEFETLLHSSTNAEELTQREFNNKALKHMRILWIPETEKSVSKEKGTCEDYNWWLAQVDTEEIDMEDVIRAYNMWNGINKRANYFVYIPSRRELRANS